MGTPRDQQGGNRKDGTPGSENSPFFFWCGCAYSTRQRFERLVPDAVLLSVPTKGRIRRIAIGGRFGLAQRLGWGGRSGVYSLKLGRWCREGWGPSSRGDETKTQIPINKKATRDQRWMCDRHGLGLKGRPREEKKGPHPLGGAAAIAMRMRDFGNGLNTRRDIVGGGGGRQNATQKKGSPWVGTKTISSKKTQEC